MVYDSLSHRKLSVQTPNNRTNISVINTFATLENILSFGKAINSLQFHSAERYVLTEYTTLTR